MSGNPSALVAGDHERDLADALRSLAADLLPPSALRACLDSGTGHPAQAWKAMTTELGLCGLMVPESYGGLGLGWAEVNTVHVELGRTLFPVPFLVTSLATTAILVADDVRAAERWLPGIANGSSTATIAWPVGRRDRVTATRDEHGWSLAGQYEHVMAAQIAQVLLLFAATQAGLSLFALDLADPGVTVEQLPGLDLTRRTCRVRFEDARAVAVGEIGTGQEALDQVGRHLRLALAAEAVGGLSWCVDTCVEHSRTREQFGRPIGSFQAVAHACVEMFAALQTARAGARWAACAQDAEDPEAELAGHVVALRTGIAYRDQTEAAIHLLGGIGFTWEHDAHLYYRRARASLALGGGPTAHQLAIAELAGLPASIDSGLV
jgi:alkylation response protein AidB-like acyl-CoA dehydrogenase